MKTSTWFFVLGMGALTATGCATGTEVNGLSERNAKPGTEDTTSDKPPPKTDAGAGTPRAPQTPGDTTTTTTTPTTPLAPTLTSVTPASAAVGSSPTGVQITVTGQRFAQGAQIALGTTMLPGTLAGPTGLTATIPAAQLNVAGVLQLSVVNPPAAGGASNALTFTVANPSSVSITSLAPAFAILGQATPVALTVTGSGFITASVIRFNGAALPTTYASATSLSATVPVSALAAAGKVSVTVSNSDTVVSLPSTFEVRYPAPTAATVNPKSATAGAGAVVVTISGTGFSSASTVLSGTTPLATTFVSDTSVRATLPASSTQNAGTIRLAVQNPTPGGGTSGQVTFTVNAATTTGTGTGTTTTCTYTCAAYGYASGECYQDWRCDAATQCLYQTTCPATGGTTTTTGNANCLYKCEDYGYALGQCSAGWYCVATGELAGCLGTTSGC